MIEKNSCTTLNSIGFTVIRNSPMGRSLGSGVGTPRTKRCLLIRSVTSGITETLISEV